MIGDFNQLNSYIKIHWKTWKRIKPRIQDIKRKIDKQE